MPILHALDDLKSVRAYLQRVGAEVRSMKTAVVKEGQGKYHRDVSIIRFGADGTVVASDEAYAPSKAEQDAIKHDFIDITFPTHKLLPSLSSLPDEVKDVPPDDIFTFKTEQGYIIMLQVRRTDDDGAKYYLPYTYWNDEVWRRCEPEGKLPLWGLDTIKDNTTVFIHEGAKAARAVQRMVAAETADQKALLKAHPWGQELSATAHLGWIGGALSPERTDWSPLKNLKQAYIVSDNDKVGVAAVAPIAKNLRCPTFHLQFTNEWPAAFDLADPFPPHMFKVLDELPRYIGPAFRSCLHPATWATDISEDAMGKPMVTLRDHFKDMWSYIEESDLFVCNFMPNIIRQEKILNNMLASFSDTPTTSELIFKAYSGRTTSLCYRPDKAEQVLTQGNSTAINLHIPTTTKAEPGNPEPFLEYLRYMFPVERERTEVERWIATLVARPDIRMEFGLLLISEAQGIGKTTLGSLVLAPLVNLNNVGYPRESDIVQSDFNGWVANKRLVIVNEIYSGQSWKAYHTLKSIITDKDITVNEKYQRPYLVENWAHIFACSNSMQALKMEADDRRWFYPMVNEERWPREKFGKLRDWLASGGLGIIKHWAEAHPNFIMPGERAPMTERKKEMISGSRSEAQHEAAALAEALVECKEPKCFAMKDIVGAIRNAVQGKVFDSDYELRKTMVTVGAYALPQRMRISGRLQYVIANNALKHSVANNPDTAQAVVLAALVKPAELLEPSL